MAAAKCSDNGGDESRPDLEKLLLSLECHFTWGLDKFVKEVTDIVNKVESHLQNNPGSWQVGGRNFLAFINEVKNKDSTQAFKNLEDALGNAKKEHGHDHERYSVVTYANFAWLYYRQDDHDKAKSYARRVSDVSDKVGGTSSTVAPEVLAEKGWSLSKCQGDAYPAAIESFRIALQGDKDNVDWMLGYAIVMSRYEWIHEMTRCQKMEVLEGEKLLKNVLDLDPQNTIAMVLLGLRLQAKHQDKKAYSYIGEAMEKSPAHPTVLKYAGMFFRRQRTPESLDASLKILQNALRLDPTSSTMEHNIGMIYFEKYKLMKRSAPRRCRTFDSSGLDLMLSKAIGAFKKGISHNEKNFPCQLDLANAFWERKSDHNSARNLYEQLLRDKSLQPEVKQQTHLSFGRFLMCKLKLKEAAKQQFQAGMDIPENTKNRKTCEDHLHEITQDMLQRSSLFDL
uniref:interferon-induced protein with tetratricopeptide repeats 1B-like n=1 Tax=Myxine glutinosa TaxID=7769 RepID=UPI0035900859